MKRLMFPILGLSVLLSGLACKKNGEVGGKSGNEAQTTVETEQSKKKGDTDVKVRVRTPAGDYNVDVKH